MPVGAAEIQTHQRAALRRFSSWKKFHNGPRKRGSLLKNLDRYPDAVLVAGCQRSGTTMLTRIIARSAGFRGLSLTHDDELDAALALCGEIDLPLSTRYCFQTTYLNEAYREYSGIGPGHRLIWVLRNPYSVVYSMVNNWKRFALMELYNACALDLAAPAERRRGAWSWPIGPSRFEKACMSYSAKTRQILAIRERIAPSQLLVVDYDELVRAPGVWLPAVFQFIGEPYSEDYSAMVRPDSISKATAMSSAARRFIQTFCEPTYRQCLGAVTPVQPG